MSLVNGSGPARAENPTRRRPRARFRIDSIATVDSRGQIVLPRESRVKAGIEKDGHLAVIAPAHEGQISCILLVKADKFAASAEELLRPSLSEITR